MGRSQLSAPAARSLSPLRAASRRASGMTRWPPATSVSLLAVATILPRSSAASVALRLTTPVVATTRTSTSSRGAMSVERVEAVLGQRRRPWLEARDLLAERLPRRGRRRGRRSRTGREAALSDVQRLPPDRAGAAQDRDTRASSLTAAPPARSSDTIASAPYMAGAANRNESTRSRKPPWPGMSVPESLAPAARLSIDSARSPAWANTAITRPSSAPPIGERPMPAEQERGHDDRRDRAADGAAPRLVGRDVVHEAAAAVGTCPRHRRRCRASRPSARGRAPATGPVSKR